MEVSGQIYVPAALPPVKGLPLLFEQEAVWAPEQQRSLTTFGN
jgi:hypothetical protein